MWYLTDSMANGQTDTRDALRGGTADGFERTAVRVSVVSIAGNAALSLFKLAAGLVAHSGAMVSDAIHSASDLFSSIIVIAGVKIASKQSDRDHPYGHERFECVAAIVLAVLLLVCGLSIGHGALGSLADGAREAVAPGALALVAAAVSVASKEAMYWYTRFYARRFDSGALMADAWHHRSDALSSIGAFVGIAGARAGFPWMDAVASLAICVFIVKAAYDIFRDAIEKMVDRSCGEDLENAISACATGQDGVLGVESIKTRVFGNRIYVVLEVFADGDLALRESDRIAKRVHDAIERKFGKIKHIAVFMKPRPD